MGLEDDDDFGGILHAAIRHASPLRPFGAAIGSEGRGMYLCGRPHLRSFARYTSFSPDHVSSTAQTFTSTRPWAKATARTTSSVRSVVTPAARFGQEIQRLPSGGRASFQDRNRAARSA